MSTAIVTHPDCLGHETPPGHPERVERLEVILEALKGAPFSDLLWEEAPLAADEAIARVHPGQHIAMVEAAGTAASAAGCVHIDADTAVSDGSVAAARRAAGAVVAAVDGIMAGRYARAFCAVRPPGHHAEPGRAMGFCLFNNIGVGAYHARAVHGLQRIAVVDFDVHHGNGTQALAEQDPDLFFASIHEGGIYPGTGRAEETGPAGNIVNVPLGHGVDPRAWRAAFAQTIVPALDAFDPDMVFISAGFDAHAADPLANFTLGERDFAWATAQLAAVAARRCGDQLVSTLEGGYDLPALARSAAAHVEALCGASEGVAASQAGAGAMGPGDTR